MTYTDGTAPNWECDCGHLNPGIDEVCNKCKKGFWQDGPRADGRMEWTCPHGVGHGNHVHGCCGSGCCSREDYPGRKTDETQRE